MMTSRRLVSAGCLLALSLAGCASDAPPPNLIPSVPNGATAVEQLSGDFCYFGPDFNLRTFRRDPKLIPFLDVEALGAPTKVSVAATAERVSFTYTNRDGVEVQEAFLPAKFKARWHEGALVVSWKVGPNAAAMIGINVVGNVLGLVLAGILHSDSYSPNLYLGGRRRESRLFRLADGRLVMTDTFRASGDLKRTDMASRSWERQDSVALLLDPADGACSVGPGRPPEAWYDEGVDLRKPDCAAELEEEIVAILAAKGEEPEQARAAVKEGLAELLAGEEAWTTLHVDCPEGVTYTLWFGKDASGCAVTLTGREGRRGKGFSRTSWSGGTLRRPLPACACN